MKKKPHYDMLINEFKIGNTLEDQDDKKQQKKKYHTNEQYGQMGQM